MIFAVYELKRLDCYFLIKTKQNVIPKQTKKKQKSRNFLKGAVVFQDSNFSFDLHKVLLIFLRLETAILYHVILRQLPLSEKFLQFL